MHFIFHTIKCKHSLNLQYLCIYTYVSLNIKYDVQSDRVQDSSHVVHNEGHAVGTGHEVATELIRHRALVELQCLRAGILKGHIDTVDLDADQSVVRRHVSI